MVRISAKPLWFRSRTFFRSIPGGDLHVASAHTSAISEP